MALPSDVLLAFPTPILRRQIPGAEAVNPALRRLVLERRDGDQGQRRSNAGDWHSREDLLTWQAPEIGQLDRWIRAGVADITAAGGKAPPQSVKVGQVVAWANVNSRGDYNKVHDHPGFDWSGVYYVDAGSPPAAGTESGTIEFLDPRAGAGSKQIPGYDPGPKLKYQPRNGMMLIFPSWLWHLVQPYFGPAERISIAFNARVAVARSVRVVARPAAKPEPGKPTRLH